MDFIKNKKFMGFIAISIAILIFKSSINFARADEEALAGKEIIKKWEKVVATVKIVIKYKMIVEGREMNKSESKIETIGTIIDPSGLVVLSLSATDPFKLLSHMDMDINDKNKFKLESEITDLKIRLYDGKELPAKIVLRDNDLDLAFIRPVAKLPESIPSIDLSNDIKPEILERIIILSRLSSIGNWDTLISLSRIGAIITKPRTLYITELSSIGGKVGCPVFSLDGKVVGIIVLRAKSSQRFNMESISGGIGDIGVLPVILPVSDILYVAKQALNN